MATVFALLLVSGTAGIVAAEGLSAVTPPDSGDAVPADGPAYGVNNSTFQRLWSDDVDNGNLSVDDFDDANVSSRANSRIDSPARQMSRSLAHHRLRRTGIAAISAITVLVVGSQSTRPVRPSKTACTSKMRTSASSPHSPRRYFTTRTERPSTLRRTVRSARSVITGLPFPRTIEMGRSVNAGQSTKHRSSRSTFLQTADCSTAQAGASGHAPVHRSFGFAAADRRRHDHGDAASRHAGLPRLEFVDSRL